MNALYDAIQRDYARALDQLLEAGADVHARMDNEMGFTAVNQAAYFGNASCITLLLEYKADPCVLDRSGGTPLVAAALSGELECIQILLQAVVDRTFDERVLRSTKSREVFEKLKRRASDYPEQDEILRNLRKQSISSSLSPLLPIVQTQVSREV